MSAYARGHVIKNLSFKVATVEYANQVTEVTLTPSQDSQVLKTGVPDGTIVDADNPSWVCTIQGINDNATGSLGLALRTAQAAGTTLACVYQPISGSAQDSAAFTIQPIAIPFGGPVGQFHTFNVTIPIVGAPVFSESA